jgi:hypothetical protein
VVDSLDVLATPFTVACAPAGQQNSVGTLGADTGDDGSQGQGVVNPPQVTLIPPVTEVTFGVLDVSGGDVSDFDYLAWQDNEDSGAISSNISSDPALHDYGAGMDRQDYMTVTSKRKVNRFDDNVADIHKPIFVKEDWVKLLSYQLLIDLAEWNDIVILNIIYNDMTDDMVYGVMNYILAGWNTSGKFQGWVPKRALSYIVTNRVDVTPSQKCMTGMTMPKMIIRAMASFFFQADSS